MAVDPGLQGGVAIFSSPEIFDTWAMPIRRFHYGTDKRRRGKTITHVDVTTLHWLAEMAHAEAIVVEQQTSMPGQSAPATGTTFVNYGLVLSLRLVAPVHVVHPATWKAKLKVPADKAKATQRCRELFPDFTVPLRDGEAEALMLALYWHQTAGGNDDVTKQRLAGAIGKAKGVRRGLRPGPTDSGRTQRAVDPFVADRLAAAGRPGRVRGDALRQHKG